MSDVDEEFEAAMRTATPPEDKLPNPFAVDDEPLRLPEPTRGGSPDPLAWLDVNAYLAQVKGGLPPSLDVAQNLVQLAVDIRSSAIARAALSVTRGVAEGGVKSDVNEQLYLFKLLLDQAKRMKARHATYAAGYAQAQAESAAAAVPEPPEPSFTRYAAQEVIELLLVGLQVVREGLLAAQEKLAGDG